MKKMLLEAYCQENLGDDLFIKVIVERYPDTKWYIITHKDQYKHNFINEYKNVRVIKLPKIITYLKNRVDLMQKLYTLVLKNTGLDGIVSIGGSIFMQDDNWKNLYKERFRLWNAFKKSGKKVFVIGSNFGPFKQKEFLSSYVDLFEKIDDVCFRDEYSYRLFNDLPNIRIAPDVVFALRENQAKFIRKTIGISVISLSNRPDLQQYEEKYLNKMADLVNKLVLMDYKVTLFSFCKHEGDEKAIHLILSKCSDKKNIESYFYNGNLDTALATFSDMEYIISCRFHALILAYIMNKPTFPIIYSEKTSNVIRDLGINQEMIHIKEIEKVSIDDILKKLVTSPNVPSSIRESAEKQFTALDKFLKI